MKFYFCEGCGVRITDADLGDGLGKNKKLKGVYCSQCAVGVTTMESLPLTDEQATDLVRSEKSSASKRRSTSQGVVQPRRRRASSRGSISLPKENRSTGKLVVLIGSVAALIVLGVIVLIPSRHPKDAAKSRKPARDKVSSADKPESPAPKESTSKKDAALQNDQKPKSHVRVPSGSDPDEASPPKQEDPQALKRKAAEAAFERLVQLSKREGEEEQRIAAAKAFLAEYGDTLLASRVRVMLEGWTKATPKPEPKAAEPDTKVEPDQAKVSNPKPEPKAVEKPATKKTDAPADDPTPKAAKKEPPPAAVKELEIGYKFTLLSPQESGFTEEVHVGKGQLCPAVDLNGDGALDIIAYRMGNGVWLNQGKGTFKPDTVPNRYIFGYNGPLWWDFNNDRRMDAINHYGAGPDKRFYSSLPNGEWRKHGVQLPFYPGFFIDLDGDGHHEECWSKGVGSYLDPKMRAWRTLPPKSTPKIAQTWKVQDLLKEKGQWGTACSVDLDGDHINELIVNDGEGSGYGTNGFGRVLSRNRKLRGIGAWLDTTAKRGLPTEDGHRFHPLDLEPDGDLDLIDSKSGYYYTNNGKGEFTQSDSRIDTAKGLTRHTRWQGIQGGFKTWDLNNDGRLDGVKGLPFGGRSLAYLSLGDGSFHIPSAFLFGGGTTALGDYDGDGDLDLVMLASPLKYYRNDTPNRGLMLFLVPRIYPSTPLGSKIWVYERGKLGKNEHLIHYRQIYMEWAHGSGKARMDYQFHVGVGKHETVDIRVRFPSGKERVKRGAKTKTTINIAE